MDVTIVSGLPRSGTSLMMQMLAAGGMPLLSDGLRAADNDNARGYLEFQPVKRLREDNSWMANAAGRALKVVCPLVRELPEGYRYRVILMKRPLEEVLASQRAMLARQGRQGSAIADSRLAEIFERRLAEAETWLQKQAHISSLTVHYHDCLAQPAVVAAAVNRFLGGGLNEQAMAAAVEPSLRHQRCGGG